VSAVGGSNGCSTAARLAITHPGLVQRIAFCWPVTVGQDHAQELSLADHISRRSDGQVAAALLGGETLRGVLDGELTSLAAPVAVMASEPENPVHRRATARALLRLSVDAVELPPMPEPPTTGFEPPKFADAIVRWLALGEATD
jgi:pimeloyl-ACP methyl ester carboxylesterase